MNEQPQDALTLLDLNNDLLSSILVRAAAHKGGPCNELLRVCTRFRDALLAVATSVIVSEEHPSAGLLRRCCRLQNMKLRGPRLPWAVTDDDALAPHRCAPPLAHLSSLTRVDLTDAVQASELPKLRCLPTLRHLRLVVDAPAIAPLAAVTTLHYLHLTFHAPVPATELRHVGALPALEVLDFSPVDAIDLNAALPHLSGLTALTRLGPSWPDLLLPSGTLTAHDALRVWAATRMAEAGLVTSRLTAASVRHLACLTALRSLRLRAESRLSDEDLAPLRSLTRLTLLHVSNGEGLSDAGFAFLRGTTGLRELRISSCRRLTHDALSAASALTALTCLCFVGDLGSVDADSLAARVAGLARLRTLEFYKMRTLTDRGMAALAGLSALTALNISHATLLTPAGFAQLSRLSSLVHVDVSGTDYRLAIPHLAALPRLQSVKLKTGRVDTDGEELMTDAALAGVSALTALTELDLSRMWGLTAGGVAHLRPLVHLRWLSLDCMLDLDAALSHVSGLTALTHLRFSGPGRDCRGLTDAGLACLLPLTALRSLCLHRARQLTDGALDGLTALQALTRLDVTRCGALTASRWGPPSGTGFPSLRWLNLRECAKLADGALARLLQPATALERLELSGCKAIAGAAFEGLAALRALTTIQLDSCPLIGPAALAALARASQLKVLDLNDCPGVTNEALEALAPLQLRCLGLAKNHNLSEDGVRTLSRMPSLQLLSLTGCPRVDDRCMEHLSSMPDLEVDVDGTAVVGHWGELVGDMPFLVRMSDSDSDSDVDADLG